MFLSIIVPVYNVNLHFLSDCIESIIGQSFTDYELILVDDGSIDSSGKLCDEYAKKSDKIRVIHKRNGGVSSARNAGLDVAQGKWLMFCDADDTLEPESFSKIYALVTQHDYDLFKFQYNIIKENGCLQKESNVVSEQEIAAIDYLKLILRHKILGACWGYLYSTKLAKSVKFLTEMSIGEDIAYVLDYVAEFQSNVFISSTVAYNYRSNPGSVTHDFKKLWNGMNYVNTTIGQILLQHSMLDICLKEYNTFLMINLSCSSFYQKRIPNREEQEVLVTIKNNYYKSDVNSAFCRYVKYLQNSKMLGNIWLTLFFNKTSINTFLARLINKFCLVFKNNISDN